MDIENGYFLDKYQSVEDYEKILSQVPWIIFGQYLIVQPWSIDFNLAFPYPNFVFTWIKFPGLPSFLYRKEILWEIGGFDRKSDKTIFQYRQQGKRALCAYGCLYKFRQTSNFSSSIQQEDTENQVWKFTGVFSYGQYGHNMEI